MRSRDEVDSYDTYGKRSAIVHGERLEGHRLALSTEVYPHLVRLDTEDILRETLRELRKAARELLIGLFAGSIVLPLTRYRRGPPDTGAPRGAASSRKGLLDATTQSHATSTHELTTFSKEHRDRLAVYRIWKVH